MVLSLHPMLTGASEAERDLVFMGKKTLIALMSLFEASKIHFIKTNLDFKFGSSLIVFLIIACPFLPFSVFAPGGSCYRQNKKEARKGKRRRQGVSRSSEEHPSFL